MQIESIIKKVFDSKHQARDVELLQGIAVHRVGIDLKSKKNIGTNALEVCQAFLKDPEVAKYTGGQIAYSFMIGGKYGRSEEDGLIWQCLPLDEIGWHARRFSVPYIGVAVIADPRIEPVTSLQRNALIDLCVGLCKAFTWNPYEVVKGHGEIPDAHGGEKAPGKPDACPGDLLDMEQLRVDVGAFIREDARRALNQAGMVFFS